MSRYSGTAFCKYAANTLYKLTTMKCALILVNKASCGLGKERMGQTICTCSDSSQSSTAEWIHCSGGLVWNSRRPHSHFFIADICKPHWDHHIAENQVWSPKIQLQIQDINESCYRFSAASAATPSQACPIGYAPATVVSGGTRPFTSKYS